MTIPIIDALRNDDVTVIVISHTLEIAVSFIYIVYEGMDVLYNMDG